MPSSPRRRGTRGVAASLFQGQQHLPFGLRAFACRRVTFFAGAKKSNQKKAPSPTSRSRRVGGEAIFGLGLLPRSENGGHPWPPPLRGFRLLVAAAGLRESKAPASPVSSRPAADGPTSLFDL